MHRPTVRSFILILLIAIGIGSAYLIWTTHEQSAAVADRQRNLNTALDRAYADLVALVVHRDCVAPRRKLAWSWELVRADGMPQDRPPLSDEEKDLLREWIAAGAPWGAATIDPFSVTTARRGGYDWWSLQPVTKASVPATTGDQWSRNDIDRFVYSKLSEAGLAPADAERLTSLVAALPRSITIVMIEHDMAVAFGLADRVSVLQQGRLLAEGAPDEISADQRVIEAYLGEVAHD